MSKGKVDFAIEESMCKTRSILVRCYNVNVDTLTHPLIHDTQEKINQVLNSNTRHNTTFTYYSCGLYDLWLEFNYASQILANTSI